LFSLPNRNACSKSFPQRTPFSASPVELFRLAPFQSLAFGVGNNGSKSGLEDFLAERVNFTEGDGAESRPFCGERESPDTGKEVNVREVIHQPSLSARRR
jgi:hypothetical protein